MNRGVAAVIVLGVVLTPLAASQPVHAADASGTTANNSTVQELRQELQAANETIDQLRQDRQRLRNEKSDIQTQLVSKNGRIQKLEFQLNQSNQQSGFSGAKSSQLKQLGAWDPYKNQPAFLVWVESEDGGLYQFVGPGNGQHSFNGMNAWTRVLGGDAQLLGNITVDLKYAPKGIEETQVYPSTNALTEIRQLVSKVNRPATRTAWERWNNDRRHGAETTESGTVVVMSVVVFGLMGGAMYVESRKDVLKNHSMWAKRKQQAAALDRHRMSSFETVPVVGRVVKKVREWRNGR